MPRFAADLEEGFLPFSLYETEHIPPERLDEEKRLLYAAMIRARHSLYLSYARKCLSGQNTQRRQEPLL